MGVKTASPGLGFDVDSMLTAAQADAFKKNGFQFCIRYLPRTPALVKGNLTLAEIQIILAAGLSLMAVQHCPEPGWEPSAPLGTQYGQYAGQYAAEIGLPAGINIWLDLEGVAVSVAAPAIIDYCHAWFFQVGSHGYIPGLYCGYGGGLSPDQLYDLPFQHYWKAYNGPPLPVRGYQIIQETVHLLEGVSFDPNRLIADNQDGLPLWLSPD